MTTRPQIDAACRQLDVAWGPARMNAGLARLQRRGSHSRHYWLGAIGIVAGAAAAFFLLKPKVSDDRWLNVAVQVGQELTLADGTVAAPEVVTARAAERPSSVQLVENSPIRQIVKVTGRARFVVAPRKGRTLRVETGPLGVEVLGTIFSVAQQGSRAAVSVQEGRVRVLWPGGTRELSANEQAVLPPEVVSSPKALSSAELWSRVDKARAAGEDARAIENLELLLEKFPKDERAAMAAFTLGVVQLTKAPDRAAAAFSRARLLSPQGPLAEDALAREVQAHAATRNQSATAEAARLYMRLYPRGLRTASVKRLATDRPK